MLRVEYIDPGGWRLPLDNLLVGLTSTFDALEADRRIVRFLRGDSETSTNAVDTRMS